MRSKAIVPFKFSLSPANKQYRCHSPLSSPRSWDCDVKESDGTSGYLSYSTSSSVSLESSAGHGIFSAYAMRSAGNIKCANILVDQDGTVKLADFGMAKQVIMQRNTGFAHAVDIWSLGCTVLEMVTGKPPWSEYEGVAAMFKVSRAEIPPIPDNLSVEGQSFIKLCLQRDPAHRPSAAALLHHPFVQVPNGSLDFKISDAQIRSAHLQNVKRAIGLSRGGSQPLDNREYMHLSSQPGRCPSRSARLTKVFTNR
ncbi:hypothetical protein GOP47_0024318 [Adiantum capillus-veneris]|uniref:Protein kinase domain-containing protein n=1 Tax=Adiantum capillus-veneris TaxID=13818 RepID=A0A9D4U2P7_ADICA|nr:hypothetical protein GOP47_0024318 [Adiantum capillus-veneris]